MYLVKKCRKGVYLIEEYKDVSYEYNMEITKIIIGFENPKEEYPLIRLDFYINPKHIKRVFKFKTWTRDFPEIIEKKKMLMIQTLENLISNGFYLT